MADAEADGARTLRPNVGTETGGLQGLQCGKCGKHEMNPDKNFLLCIGTLTGIKTRFRVLYPDSLGNCWTYICTVCRELPPLAPRECA